MSEYAEILPGFWSVSCFFRKKGGCAGEMHVTPDGAIVCHAHAVSELGLREQSQVSDQVAAPGAEPAPAAPGAPAVDAEESPTDERPAV